MGTVLAAKTRYNKREPLVSIQGKGTINFNEPVKQLVGDYVMLLYNPRKNQLGLKPATLETKGSYAVRPVGATSQTYVVSGLGLFANYGIDTEKAKGKYRITEENGIVVIQLPTNGG
jgi:hypothetical protein